MPAEPPQGTRIRVVLVGVRRMLSELVTEALAVDPDIEIACETVDRTELPSLASRKGADVVIIGGDEPNPSAAFDILRAVRPRLRVLAITDDGRETLLYELQPHEVALGQLSGAGLLDAVRGSRGVG